MAENLGSIYAELRLTLTKFEADVEKAKAQLGSAARLMDQLAKEAADNLKRRMEDVAGTLRQAGQALVGAGLAVAGGLGAAVWTTARFDQAMSRVRALADATEQEFQRLRDTAIELGGKTVFSASQAAEGMAILAAAGLRTQEIIDAMPGLLDAAAAAGEDFATTAEIMVSAMAGFGLAARDMAHIADVLAAAANASAITIRDIGYSLKYVAPVAAASGATLEEVAAALAILGNAGIKAEQAGTTLRMALIRLADPPREAQQVLRALGVQLTDSQGRMLPLADIIAQLHERFQGLSEAEQLFAASTIFGAEAMSGMMALIQAGPEPLRRLTAEFQRSEGTARRMAETMQSNLAGAWEQLRGALETAAIRIGEQLAPTLEWLAGVVTRLVDAFSSLPAPVQRAIALGAALAAGFALIAGPLLILIGLMPSIAAGFAVLRGSWAGALQLLAPLVAGLRNVGASMLSLAGIARLLGSVLTWVRAHPIALLLAAIPLLILAGRWLIQHWDELALRAAIAWSYVKTAVLRAVDGALAAIQRLLGWIPGIGAAVERARQGIAAAVAAEEGARARAAAGLAALLARKER